MLYVSGLTPAEVHIARGTVDDPVDRAPQGHVFIDHAVAWVSFDDDLPRLTSHDPRLEKYRQVPDRE